MDENAILCEKLPMLRKFARYLARRWRLDPSAAESAAILGALMQLRRWDGVHSLNRWLYLGARQAVIREYRREYGRQRGRFRSSRMGMMLKEPDFDRVAASVSSCPLRRAQAREELENLLPKDAGDRRIVLSYFRDLKSLHEIGAEEGKSWMCINYRLRRILKPIRGAKIDLRPGRPRKMASRRAEDHGDIGVLSQPPDSRR